jgi:hypothetical protein
MGRSITGDVASMADGIAALDALSRKRALTEEESRQLERLINRQKAASAPPNRKPSIRRSRPVPASLDQRLRSTLATMRADFMVPRAIYLAEADLAAAAALGFPDAFDGLPIRPVKGRGRSCIYSNQGVARSLGQRGVGAVPYPFITSSSPAGQVESPVGGGDSARRASTSPSLAAVARSSATRAGASAAPRAAPATSRCAPTAPRR